MYHLTSRGNARAAIFCDDADRLEFLGVLGNIVEQYNWCCHSYCLMDNHYHVLVETPDANLSSGMRQLGGIYTQKFNRRHNQVGHVFQGRYKSILVEKHNYLLELCRYIVLNPVRARLVASPADYPWSSYGATAGCRYIVLNPVRARLVASPADYSWSSYGATAGLTNKVPFLCTDWILSQFGNNRETAQDQYRDFVMAGIGKESPWRNLRGQSILGGEDFLEKLSPYLEGKSGEKEIPRRARFAGRPPLSKFFPGSQAKPERNTAIATAHLHYGYSQAEIAAAVNLHYSTVSRIVQREKEQRSKSKT